MTPFELESAIQELKALCDRLGVQLVIGSAKRQVAVVKHVETVQRLVADAYGYDLRALRGKSRVSRLAWARMSAMALCRDFGLGSLASVARDFYRNHATVTHACAAVKARCQTEPSFAVEYSTLRDRLATIIKRPA
jgi:chromosomal replication initiator protein